MHTLRCALLAASGGRAGGGVVRVHQLVGALLVLLELREEAVSRAKSKSSRSAADAAAGEHQAEGAYAVASADV